MSSIALAFNRRTGADGAGHSGWGFTLGDDTFLVGSVDNPPHTLYTRPAKMGFWAIRTRDPLGVASAHAYREAKVIELAYGAPEHAVRVAAWHSRKPYKLFGCNCMNVSYDVLRAFGTAHLPAPALHWEPNHWFDHIQGERLLIDEGSITLAPSPQRRHPADVRLPAVDGEFMEVVEAIAPTTPRWRVEHTTEANELKAAMEQAPRLPSTAPYRAGLIGWIIGLLRPGP